MKELGQALLMVCVILGIYYLVDALTTKDPKRRKTDLQDLRILGAGMNVIKAI